MKVYRAICKVSEMLTLSGSWRASEGETQHDADILSIRNGGEWSIEEMSDSEKGEDG